MQVRTEVKKFERDNNNEIKMTNIPILNSVIYETLRYLPPLSQIINRKTSKITNLNHHIIPGNTFVGYLCISTGRNKEYWGIDAEKFNPLRWGKTISEINERYKNSKRNAELIAFHGGSRSCMGEKFALLESKLLIIELVKHFKWELDSEWHDKMTSGGPLCPLNLKLRFTKL